MDQDNEISQFLLERKYFSVSTSYPDKMVLEIGLQQMMREDAAKPSRPYKIQEVTKKSKETCVVCCIMGEKALAANKNNEALKAFTNALRVAPASLNITAHCYYYRSVALQKLKAYSESLQDIERALELRITENQKANLQNRKTVIQKLLLRVNSSNSTKNNIAYEEVTLSYGENTEIKGVTSAIALVYNTRLGRHYIATQNIEVGDVLMIQKPYASVIIKKDDDSPKETEWVCENCFKTTKAPITCDNCAMLFYCSNECKSEAYDKFHKTECKLVNINAPLGPYSSLFLRTLLIMTKQGQNFKKAYNLMEDVKNRRDRRTAGFKNGKLEGTNDEAILSLMHHRDKSNLTMIVSHATQVAVELKKHTDFLKGSNDVRSLAELLILLSYICIRNLYCLRGNKWTTVSGLAMYPVMNLLNHACACNTLSYNDKHGNMILRACKNIKKGDQIFVSYFTFDSLFLSSEERKCLLQEGKFFTCECEACVRDYTYNFELKGALRVPKELKFRLKKNRGKDTEALWKVLKLILKKCPGPCREAKILELALVDAYLGTDVNLYQKLLNLKIV